MPNLLTALWILGFFAVLLGFSSLVRPSGPSEPQKNKLPSGEKVDEKPWIRMSARYQALIAVAATFFLGILLLYPAVSTFRHWLDQGRGIGALTAVGFFLGILSVALAYAWMKGDLSWIVDKEENGHIRKHIS